MVNSDWAPVVPSSFSAEDRSPLNTVLITYSEQEIRLCKGGEEVQHVKKKHVLPLSLFLQDGLCLTSHLRKQLRNSSDV